MTLDSPLLVANTQTQVKVTSISRHQFHVFLSIHIRHTFSAKSLKNVLKISKPTINEFSMETFWGLVWCTHYTERMLELYKLTTED